MAARKKLGEEDDDLPDSVAKSNGDASIISFEDTAPLTGPTSHHHSTNLPYHRVTRVHGTGHRSRFPGIHHAHMVDDDDKKPRRSFCRSWCEMWFLFAQKRVTCIGLSAVLFGGGFLLFLLTAYGGLTGCHTLHGAVIFCQLMATLSISMGCLCCCYHWVKDDDDLPFAIFCVAYCFLLLFMFVTIAGTVVVFTRIHPLGPDQPPPGIPLPNTTLTAKVDVGVAAGTESTVDMTAGTMSTEAAGDEYCSMVELPLGVLVICYSLSLGFAIMSYVACILALGDTSDIPPL